jgi:hypothetical protein
MAEPAAPAHPPEPVGDLSGRATAIALALLCVVSLALLAKQLACFSIASKDACSFYLPLAQQAAEGNWSQAQHPVIPPLYPVLAGLASRTTGWATDPQQAGAQLLNAVLLPPLVLAVFGIGAAWSRRVGIAMAALTAANPWVIRFAAEVGPELLYALLLTLAVLSLVRYVKRPGLWWALGAAAAAALATLTRSEGLFLLPLTLVVVLAARVRKRGRATFIHMAAMVLLAALIWLPRASFVHETSGWWLLDVRLLQKIPGARSPGQWYRHPDAVAHLQPGPGEGESLTERLDEAQETLTMVPGPHVWLLAIVGWLFVRKHMTRRVRLQLLLLAVMLAQIMMTAWVEFDRRYTVPLVGLFQLWPALALWGLAGLHARRHCPKGGRQLWAAALAGLVVALGLWSLFGTNAGSRHAELRCIGAKTAGLQFVDPVIMASSSQGPYYADARAVLVASRLTGEQLARHVERFDVDLLIYGGDDEWLPGLAQQLAALGSDSDAFVARCGRGNLDDQAWLLTPQQAQALIAPMQSGPSAQTASMPTTTPATRR